MRVTKEQKQKLLFFAATVIPTTLLVIGTIIFILIQLNIL